jgi:glycosyltransferase involved in cell wall biosynthesis
MNSRPLKLALVTRRYPPLIGGAEKVLSYLAEALAAEGADITVITSQAPGLVVAREEQSPITACNNAVSMGYASPAQPKIVRLVTSQLRFLGTWRYMHNLKMWFQKNPVDLAYVSMLKHDAYSVVSAGERLNFPVVLRPEGAGATGDIAWQSWGNFGRVIGQRCRRAAAFVAISKSIEHELRESWHSGTMRPSQLAELLHQTPKEPCILSIPNGVPIPEFTWQRRPDWRSGPRAVFVGRLAAEKGLDTLIEAWPLVRAKYTNAQLILIGEGPLRLALMEKVKALGMALGPGQAVEMPGAASEPSKPLRGADLFILPSREEGMSIALLEAMALSIPLVASSIPGNRRLVSDFEHGRLATPDDPGNLAQAIIDQWDDFDRAILMGRAARHRVNQEFSIRHVARKHISVFEDLLRSRTRP